MKVIEARTEKARVNKVKKVIKSAGNKIASVHFVRRKDGKLRRMSFRLGVQNPAYAMKPSGKRFSQRKERDEANLQMTVYDVNKVRRNKKGKIAGRGDWRCIPLNNVKRICVNGTIYKVKSA